jgi:hypothetical protein
LVKRKKISPKKKHQYPIVEVEWVDSSSYPGWQKAPEKEPITCWTAGYLVHKDKVSLVIALSSSSEESINSFGDTITIPTSVVKKIRKVK